MAHTVNLLAALRQLACLGLPGKAALPEALELLRQLVGFDMETAHFMDRGYRLSDVYAPPYFPLRRTCTCMPAISTTTRARPRPWAGAGASSCAAGAAWSPVSERVGRAAVERTEFWDCLLPTARAGCASCRWALARVPGAC